MKDVGDLAACDAFVIGSAAYMFHLREATAFVKRHRAVLAQRPVWLFSSGPLGTDLVDEHDIFEATRPKEFAELGTSVFPREERVFFGAWDPQAPAIGFGERFLSLMPASRATLPAGDFRDWPAIDAWAAEIAPELRAQSVKTDGDPPPDPSFTGEPPVGGPLPAGVRQPLPHRLGRLGPLLRIFQGGVRSQCLRCPAGEFHPVTGNVGNPAKEALTLAVGEVDLPVRPPCPSGRRGGRPQGDHRTVFRIHTERRARRSDVKGHDLVELHPQAVLLVPLEIHDHTFLDEVELAVLLVGAVIVVAT